MIEGIVDLSHWNAAPDFARAYSKGVLGVIHKATQGTRGVDPTYAVNRQKALDAGLWWGAYHFASAEKVSDQVEHFLSVAKPGTDTLLALDWEPNVQQGQLTPMQAAGFCNTLHPFRPLVYTPQSWTRKLLLSWFTEVPPLWVARYNARVGPVSPWPRWTLWQYTDGAFGHPPAIPGLGHCDRSRFNGSLQGLKRLWGVA